MRHVVEVASHRRAYRQMTVASVLWGTIGPAVAIVHRHSALSAVQTSFWRLAIAIAPLTLIAVIATRGAPLRRSSIVTFGLGVGVLTGLSQLAYFAAVTSAGIAVSTLISNGLGPVLTVLGQLLVFGDRPDCRTLVALTTALVGLGLLVLDAPTTATIAGVLLALLAAVTFAMASLAAGPATRRMDVSVLNAAAIAGGAVAMLPVVLATGGPGLADSAVGWLALLHLGLVVTGVAYGLYFSAARHLSPAHLTILMLLEPLVATATAVAAFGEHLTIGAMVGGVLMISAVGLLRPGPATPVATPA